MTSRKITFRSYRVSTIFFPRGNIMTVSCRRDNLPHHVWYEWRVGLSIWDKGSLGMFFTWKLRSAVCTSELSSAVETLNISWFDANAAQPRLWTDVGHFGCGLGPGLGLGLEPGVGLGLRPYPDPNRNQNTLTAYQPKDPFSQIVMGPPNECDKSCSLLCSVVFFNRHF